MFSFLFAIVLHMLIIFKSSSSNIGTTTITQIAECASGILDRDTATPMPSTSQSVIHVEQVFHDTQFVFYRAPLFTGDYSYPQIPGVCAK